MALLESTLLSILLSIILLIVIAAWYASAEFDFFKKRGIPYVKPLPFFGNFWKVVAGKKSLVTAIEPLYEELKKHKWGGVFVAQSPTLLVCDPDLIKLVLTKDFTSFHDRGIPFDEKNNPLSANLVNMPGPRWRSLRNKTTPIYTSGKLKQMLPLMMECSENLSKVLREKSAKGEVVDMMEYMVRFVIDVVGTCAFGIEVNCLSNPDSEFYLMSSKLLKPSFLNSIRFTFFSDFKWIMKLMAFKTRYPGLREFFIDLMKDTIQFRKKNNVVRNDLVHLMMQLQKEDEGKTPESHPDEVIFTDNIIAAQAFVFFTGGLESIAYTTGWAIYQMSLHPKLQDDVAAEVNAVVENSGGKITYEGLKEMKLLERVISETLRMYSTAGVMFREITSSGYTLPGSDTVFKKGMKVLIPTQGVHYDADIYPEPTKFDPDRFTEEEIAKRHPYAYLPFGEGPRVCIANRFSLLECKLVLASVFKEFRISPSSRTRIPAVLEPRNFNPTPIDGLPLKIELRNH